MKGLGNGTRADGLDGITGNFGTFFVIPEYSIIAIPVTFTLIIFFVMRRRQLKRLERSTTAGKEVVA